MSSLSDQFRRLFSGTLGLLPIVFPNRAQGGTLVHFWRDCPYNIIGPACQYCFEGLYSEIGLAGRGLLVELVFAIRKIDKTSLTS